MVQLGKHSQKSLARTCVPKPCRSGSKIGKRIHHLVSRVRNLHRPFNSRSKSRAKERDAANVPKLLQTNNPNIKPFAQEQEKGRNGSTGQTSGDWGEMKHGRVNTECLNSLILDDDRGFHYHNAIADN